MAHHTLSVLVRDHPGVLTRVAGLFARRAFNINSLAVGPTEVAGLSRMTLVVDSEVATIEQVIKHLNKLIDVLKVVELDMSNAVQRSHMLIKVRADGLTRTQVAHAANLFRAAVVDVGQETVIVEATGQPDKLEALCKVLEPFEIKEVVESGAVAMSRGRRSMSERIARGA